MPRFCSVTAPRHLKFDNVSGYVSESSPQSHPQFQLLQQPSHMVPLKDQINKSQFLEDLFTLSHCNIFSGGFIASCIRVAFTCMGQSNKLC